MGGFDKLHDKLGTLGADGEKMWIKLTQGVGKNDPQAAQAAIDDITKALDAQKQQQDENTAATKDAGVATEEAAQATIETATEASAALDTLNQKIGDNKATWDDWSKYVTAAVNKVGDAVNAVSFGHSPGGIKEIPLKLAEARAAVQPFASTFIAQMASAKAAADSVSGADVPGVPSGGMGDMVAAMQSDVATQALQTKMNAANLDAANASAAIHLAEGAIQIDRPILKDRQAMQDLAIEVSKQMKKALVPSGAWA
jgi:hypothetical protein